MKSRRSLITALRAKGCCLRSGMVLAIEPMINAGSHEVKVLKDGWTAVTVDRSLSAHFEHTVAITPKGPEILTVDLVETVECSAKVIRLMNEQV